MNLLSCNYDWKRQKKIAAFYPLPNSKLESLCSKCRIHNLNVRLKLNYAVKQNTAVFNDRSSQKIHILAKRHNLNRVHELRA